MKSLSRTAQISVLSILLLATVNSGWSSSVPLLAMTDTNNPQSTLATFSLTESNLQFVTITPYIPWSLQIMCSSNDVAVGGTVWLFMGLVTNMFPRPIPPPPFPQTNAVILPNPFPPILVINTNPVIAPILGINTNPVIIPPNPIYDPPSGGSGVVIGTTFQPPMVQPPIVGTNLIPTLSITDAVVIVRNPTPTPIYVPPANSSRTVMGTASVSPIGFAATRMASVVSELTPPPRLEQIATNVVFSPGSTNEIELTAEQVALFRDGFGIIQFFWLGSGPTTAFIRPVDSDNDGVPDGDDQCPGTEPGSLVDSEGCGIEQLAPCDGPWRNHGEFVNAFKAVTSHFLRSGLINAKQARELNAAAAQSGCGN